MLFSRNLFAAFLTIAAVDVSGSPVKPEKQTYGVKFKFCENKYWGVPCVVPDFIEMEKCHEFLSEFSLTNVQSFGPPPGLACTVYETPNCTLPAATALLWYPGHDRISNDPGYNFTKHGPSSFRCQDVTVAG